MSDLGRCTASTRDRWPAQCHRQAVEEVNGRALCKPHAAGERRSLAHRRAQTEERQASAERDRALSEQAKRLGAALQTEVDCEYSWHRKGGYTGRMVVDADFLERIASTEAAE